MSCVGHVLLGDFNVACVVKRGVPVNSVSGTRPYMGNVIPYEHFGLFFMFILAPEMFAPPPQGYLYSVDWWSLGVTAYQLLRAQVLEYLIASFVICGHCSFHLILVLLE